MKTSSILPAHLERANAQLAELFEGKDHLLAVGRQVLSLAAEEYRNSPAVATNHQREAELRKAKKELQTVQSELERVSEQLVRASKRLETQQAQVEAARSASKSIARVRQGWNKRLRQLRDEVLTHPAMTEKNKLKKATARIAFWLENTLNPDAQQPEQEESPTE